MIGLTARVNVENVKKDVHAASVRFNPNGLWRDGTPSRAVSSLPSPKGGRQKIIPVRLCLNTQKIVSRPKNHPLGPLGGQWLRLKLRCTL